MTISERISASRELSRGTTVTRTDAYDNFNELSSPLVHPPMEDFDPSEHVFKMSQEEADIATIKGNEGLRDLSAKFSKSYDPEIKSNEKRNKGLYERVFGVNLDTVVPADYYRRPIMERLLWRAKAGAQDFAERAGIGATKSAEPFIKFFTPKHLEKNVTVDFNDEGNTDPLFVREREKVRFRQLKELSSEMPLDGSEQKEYEYYKKNLPSTMQKAPEFIGVAAEKLIEFKIVSETLAAAGLTGKLTKIGTNVVGKYLPKTAATSTPVIAAYSAIVKAIEHTPAVAAEMFVWGTVSSEGDAKERAVGGAEMMPWAVVPLIVSPAFAAASKTAAGKVIGKTMQRVFTKMTSKRYAAKQIVKQKKEFVNEAVSTFDDMYYAENKVLSTPDMKDAVKKLATQVADKTQEVAKMNADDMAVAIMDMTADNAVLRHIGTEGVSRAMLPEAAVQNYVDDTISMFNARSKFQVREFPNGYSILRSDGTEVAGGLKRKHLADAMNDAVYGVSKKPNAVPLRQPHVRKTITINEDVELRNRLKMMKRVGNSAFKEGKKTGIEVSQVKINDLRDRINTIKAGHTDEFTRVAAARKVVRDIVPPTEQGRFIKRVTEARTTGKLGEVIKDIEAFVEGFERKVAALSLRGSLKALVKKFGSDFRRAPDHVQPVLKKLYAGIDVTKTSNPGIVDDLSGLHDDITTLAKNTANYTRAMNADTLKFGNEEISSSLQLPESMSSWLDDIAARPMGELSAADVKYIDKVVKMVQHQSEISNKIWVGGQEIKLTNYRDGLETMVRARNFKMPARKGKKGVKDLLGVESDHPSTLLERMFGMNSPMKKMLDDLYESETRASSIMFQSYDYVHKYLKDNGLSTKDFHRIRTDNMKVILGGKETKITRDEAIGIMSFFRDTDNFEQYLKSTGAGIRGTRLPKKPTLDEITDIISQLTDDDKMLAGAYFQLNNAFLSPIVNDTSLKINGVKLWTDTNHFSRHRMPKTPKAYGNKFSVKTNETRSMFMPREGGTAPIEFRPFTKELMDSIQGASMYSETAIPLRSIKTVMTDPKLYKRLSEAQYTKEVDAFLTIISRGEGLYADSSSVDVMAKGIINRFSKSILGGRISTVGTQISSIPAAKAVIPAKHFKITDHLKWGGTKTLEAKSAFFKQRWIGARVNVAVGDVGAGSAIQRFLEGTTPISEKPLAGLIWGDKRAANQIFQAAKREGGSIGMVGDSLEQFAIKRTEEAFRQTQPVWNIWNRSMLASDSSLWKKSFMPFRTAQEAQFNILKRANIRLSRGDISKSEYVSEIKAVGESVFAVSAWKTLWRVARNSAVAATGIGAYMGFGTPENKYEDNVVSDTTKAFGKSALGLLPGGTPLATAIEKLAEKAFGNGYSANAPTDVISSVINTTFEATGTIAKWYDLAAKSLVKRGVDENGIPLDIKDEFLGTEIKKGDRDLFAKGVKDLLVVLRGAGIVTGLAVGPLDEWAIPLTKSSKHKLVRNIEMNEAHDVPRMQQLMDKFLTRFNKLANKTGKQGLSGKEFVEYTEMKPVKETIDLYDYEEYRGLDGIMEDVEETLHGYYNN